MLAHRCSSLSSFAQLQDQIAPTRAKERAKETERSKFRDEAKKEEHKRSELLNNFKNDFDKISHLSKHIQEFVASEKLHRLKSLDSELSSIREDEKENEAKRKSIAPELEQLNNRVNDQQAHQVDIQRNIELLDMVSERQLLEDDLALLEDKKEKSDPDSIRAEYEDAKNKVQKYQSEADRRDGSKEAFMTQQRELKVRDVLICSHSTLSL